MSLLPKIVQFRDPELSMPLGAAIPRAVEVKPDPNAWFDEEGRKYADDTPPQPVRFPIFKRMAEELRAKSAPPSPATPVAVPTFKPWDRVRITCEGIREHGMCGVYLGKTDTGYHLVKLDDGSEGCWAFDDSLELLPSEPKADAEWVAWGEGDVPQGALFHVKRADGSLFGECSRNAISTLWGDPIYKGWTVKQQ